MTKLLKLSINTIDKIDQVCYTQIKLENKTNILTNKIKTKTNQKQKGTKMAEKLNIPTHVVNSDWKDDIDVDYAIYGDNEREERNYISPEKVDDSTKNKIAAIKRRNIKLGKTAMLFSSKI